MVAHWPRLSAKQERSTGSTPTITARPSSPPMQPVPSCPIPPTQCWASPANLPIPSNWRAHSTITTATAIMTSTPGATSKPTRLGWRGMIILNTGRYIQADPIGLAGDDNPYAYAGGNPLGFMDPDGLCSCGSSRSLIAQARSDKRDWSKSADRSDVRSGFGKGTYKCNLFVDTQYEKSGYSLPNIGGGLLARIFGRYPPGAANLSMPSYSVPDWPVVTGPPKVGDLIAFRGHVGIVSGNGKSISATPDGVKENDWGFRPGQTPVIRRCLCQ